jgi:histidinol phosphatase-like enzyme
MSGWSAKENQRATYEQIFTTNNEQMRQMYYTQSYSNQSPSLISKQFSGME